MTSVTSKIADRRRIAFVVTKAHEYTMSRYLKTWGAPLAHRIQIFYYDDLFADSKGRLYTTVRHYYRRMRQAGPAAIVPDVSRSIGGKISGQLWGGPRNLSNGKIVQRLRRYPTVIFSDLERLTPVTLERCSQVFAELAQEGRHLLLNHPTRAMRRFELLRTLYEDGTNDFNVYRVTDCRIPQRYPVFVRSEADHKGNRTPLLGSAGELTAAIDAMLEAGTCRDDKIIVEFSDVSDAQGIVRKYSCFFINGRVIPKHVFFSQQWMLKSSDLKTPEYLKEEWEFIQQNPHEDFIRQVFSRARIDYGRIDYSVSKGKIRVWEINTNPMILFPENRDDHQRRAVHDWFGHQFAEAIAQLGP